jgi:hypothetical protein
MEYAAAHVLNPDIFDRVLFASDAMPVASDIDFATAEAWNLSIENKAFRGVKKVQDAILVPLGKADLGTKYSVWLASYADKYFELTWKEFDFDNGRFESNKQAVRHADMMMQMAIGSKDSAHLPPVMRNTLWRITLMLQSFVVRRYSQLFIRLPNEWEKGNKSKVARSYAILVATTLAQTMVSPIWNTILASMGFKDEKEFEERLTGKSDAEVDDIMMTLAMKTISSFTPWASNVFDLWGGWSGLGITSAAKQFATSAQAVSQSLSNRTEAGQVKETEGREAGINAIGLLTPFVWGAPLRILKDALMTKEKARKETADYKYDKAQEIKDYKLDNADTLREEAVKKMEKRLEEKLKKKLKE